MALTLKSTLDRALQAEYGILLTFSTRHEAYYHRRRLYAEREKIRRDGNIDYDGLSFIVRNMRELLVVQRNTCAVKGGIIPQGCRDLRPDEMPDKILSRGKSRPGVGIS